MRYISQRATARAAPIAAVVLAAAACQGVIYLFAAADIGFAAASASMLAIAAVVVASLVWGRSESERRLVGERAAPAMPARRPRAAGTARARA